MSAMCPEFLRESVWRTMSEGERQGIVDLLVVADTHAERLAKALEDVERHRRLARGFAEQAKTLLESVRRASAVDSHGSPPSVVRRVERLHEDLEATARSAGARVAAPDREGELVYTPPVPPPTIPAPDVPLFDDDRMATQPGATRRTHGLARKVSEDPDADLRPRTYSGDIEEL